MAALAPRTRDLPDIRARLSINDESPDDIKEQLQLADQRQKALRSQQSWHQAEVPGPLRSNHRAGLRKIRTLSSSPRPGHFNDLPVSDPLPCPLNRSHSFNSLSTLHREAEVAALSQYRGSPISAISPPCAASLLKLSIDYEPQDPCPPRPPLRVETLRQQQKYQKLLRKSLKKKQKEQLRAQKEEDQLRRALLAAEVADARRKDEAVWGQSLPRRHKSTRAIASQVVNTLSLKRPLSRLARHVKRDKTNPPRLEDFDSKEEIRQYLNPARISRSKEIAELPAELPQYTPFQDSTRTQDNEPVALLEDAPSIQEKKDVPTHNANRAESSNPRATARSMRCDSCQSPIRRNQVYYHCSICEGGDRMLCTSCDHAGWSCRHEITEKVRSVSRARSLQRSDSIPLENKRTRREAPQYAAAMRGLDTPDFSAETNACTESPIRATMSADSPWAYHDRVERLHARRQIRERRAGSFRKLDDVEKTEYHRREQSLAFREKEFALRDREINLRERQSSFREHEAALRIEQQAFALQQSAMARQINEASLGVGAQFQELFQNDNIRAHANKRKAGSGRATVSPSNSISTKHDSPLKYSPGGGQGPYDEDEDDNVSGTPKKIKQEPDSVHVPEKLFACPFCKSDKSRYSEQNVHEKHYRGCSSGYWPDISRLKQHLYRVHWRRIHCGRCYTKFERKELLDQHVRGAQPCPLVECPYPEKFDDTQYNDIRRKRPTSSPEEVWYTIYGILFPGDSPPSTPYADTITLRSPAALSPAAPECQDTMEVLGEVFESRLNQHSEAPGQAWLRSPDAREFIRQQLRASMTDVLRRLDLANTPSAGNPSVDVSPYSTVAPEAARRGSISLTPPHSVLPSPVNGPGLVNRPSLEAHLLLPGHRQSFSRPLAPRTASRPFTSHPDHISVRQHPQEGGESPASVTFHTARSLDPENDQYDEECHSWSHGDELGLAISTDFNFDFDPTPASAGEELGQQQEISAPPPPSAFKFTPVKLVSVADSPRDGTTVASQLNPKHSTSSSVDSGYGSLGHKSSSSSTPPSSTSPRPTLHPRPVRGRMKGKRREQVKESSPVPESAINYDALGVPFMEFLGGDLNLDMDDLGNVGGESLSAYLDTRYPVLPRPENE